MSGSRAQNPMSFQNGRATAGRVAAFSSRCSWVFPRLASLLFLALPSALVWSNELVTPWPEPNSAGASFGLLQTPPWSHPTACVVSLLVTVAVEFFIWWLFLRRDALRLLLYALLVNAFTQPLAVYLSATVVHSILLIEVTVFLAESALIWALLHVRIARALLVSFVANLATAMIGVVYGAVVR